MFCFLLGIHSYFGASKTRTAREVRSGETQVAAMPRAL